MKKIVLGLSLFIGSYAFAQKGLEKIIVEKYYVTNAADAAQAEQDAADNSTPTGTLPAGSITYRVYADLAPGYRIVSIYGDANVNHSLKIATTTLFYNHPLGTSIPTFAKSQIKNNLLALDSYLSLGAAAKDTYGVMKAEDDGVASNFAANTTVLLNTDPVIIGAALTDKDGLISKIKKGPMVPTFAGIAADDYFGDANATGNTLDVSSGSMYTTDTARALDTLTNKVLIAQLTTNGKLTFELNMIVQSTGNGETFVAKNPDTSDPNKMEYSIPSLIYPDLISGIDNPAVKKAYDETLFAVYPNPINDHVNIELTASEPNSKGSYTLYGVIGNVIAHKELNGISGTYKETIDMSAFAKGLYTIQMNINGASSTKKIIKN
jgi:hypothetical protein